MIEYIVALSKQDAAKLASKADAAGVTCDLEYLQNKIAEWLNEDARLTHCEK